MKRAVGGNQSLRCVAARLTASIDGNTAGVTYTATISAAAAAAAAAGDRRWQAASKHRQYVVYFDARNGAPFSARLTVTNIIAGRRLADDCHSRQRSSNKPFQAFVPPFHEVTNCILRLSRGGSYVGAGGTCPQIHLLPPRFKS